MGDHFRDEIDYDVKNQQQGQTGGGGSAGFSQHHGDTATEQHQTYDYGPQLYDRWPGRPGHRDCRRSGRKAVLQAKLRQCGAEEKCSDLS